MTCFDRAIGFDPIILAPIGFKAIDLTRYVLSCQRGLVELKNPTTPVLF